MMNTQDPSRRGPAALRRLIAPCLAAAVIALAGCTQTDPDGGGTENSGIRLTGRVVGNNNSPIAGVVVALSRTGLTDTTDALGRYVISRVEEEEESGELVLDTLRYTKNGQALARVSVLQWVDTLPDVQVIQRDVSGLLDTEGLTATRIEAVLLGDGIDTANPVTAEFYYNALTGNYSGFLYFPPTSGTSSYSVQINVYGAGDVLIGQSALVPFNSFAGNITVPAFSAGNSVPVAKAGADTAVALGATVNLRGSATDAFGGVITKWEWSIGGSPFVQTSTGDTSFTRATHGAYPAILRVTDDDGNTDVDTVQTFVVSHGTNWTTRTSGTTSNWTGVTWTGTQFVAVGGDRVARSSDGINWTTQTVDLGSPTSTFTGVVWTGQKLIATKSSPAMMDTGVYYASTDGITWTPGGVPPIARGMNSAMLVSVADSTVMIYSRGSDHQFMARSEDHGATWLVDTLPPTTHSTDGPLTGFMAYTKHAGRFVAVGAHGQTASSTGDGIWVRHTNAGSFPRPHGGVYDYMMQSVVSTGNHAVAVGYAGHVMRSSDGMTWMQPRIAAGIPDQESGSSLGDLSSVTWTGNTLVAVGNGFTVLSADGGANWVQVPAGSGALHSVAWNGTRLVAVGNQGRIVTSE